MTVGIWFLIIILFIVIEVLTSAALIAIWVIPPAIISCIMCANGASNSAQFTVFTIGFIFLLLITRPIVRKLGKNCDGRTNIYALYNREIILESFDKENKIGKAKINGVSWVVKSELDTYSAGDTAKIIEVKGSSLII